MDTPHNRRVQAQRAGAVVKFCESTGADTHTANALLQQHAYDLDRAVGAFFDGGAKQVAGGGGGGGGGRSSSSGGERSNALETNGPDGGDSSDVREPVPSSRRTGAVDRILDAAAPPREPASDRAGADAGYRKFAGSGRSLRAPATATPGTSRAAAGGGTGQSRLLAPDPEPMSVHVTFYANGFTVEVTSDSTAERQKKPPRRRGIARFDSLDDDPHGASARDGQFSGQLPLRSYDDSAGKQFMREVEQQHVPLELRKIDPASRKPVPVNIMLADRRPADYHAVVPDVPTHFAGQGRALGGSTTGSTSVARARDAAHTGSRIWELVMSWIVWAAAIVRSLLRIAPRAPSRPLVRTGDPVTTIQVRLHGGRRLAVQLNRELASQIGTSLRQMLPNLRSECSQTQPYRT